MTAADKAKVLEEANEEDRAKLRTLLQLDNDVEMPDADDKKEAGDDDCDEGDTGEDANVEVNEGDGNDGDNEGDDVIVEDGDASKVNKWLHSENM